MIKVVVENSGNLDNGSDHFSFGLKWSVGGQR